MHAPPNSAYILENQVTHARLLPTPSKHAFSYPTLALFLSLDALEEHALDLAHGWFFGYGGTAWRVTGLRSGAYLLPDAGADNGGKKTIKDKLREVLGRWGYAGETLGRVWVLTMPSYMGYEGINPLTVHYCYEREKEELAWVVLEIHNTFGEKHVHVLRTGKGEDDERERPPGYDHQWTFARDFHVSPFNDRRGHYVVSVTAPPPPGSPCLVDVPPRPKIRIHLHAADTLAAGPPTAKPLPDDSEVGPLKLTAIQVARTTVPFNAGTLGAALARYPFALFLSFVRILYHAWILHYVKRLDVFPRPDPKPAVYGWGIVDGKGKGKEREQPESGLEGEGGIYGGVGWQDEGPLEGYARRRVERLLARQAGALGVRLKLIAADPAVPPAVFAPTHTEKREGLTTQEQELVVHYAAPRFFTTLLASPSPAHALLVGRAENLVRVNSEKLFFDIFAGNNHDGLLRSATWGQRVRMTLLPRRFVRAVGSGKVPLQHPLDEGKVVMALNTFVVCLLYAADEMERLVFTLVKARFVPGMEPWRRWERAADAVRA